MLALTHTHTYQSHTQLVLQIRPYCRNLHSRGHGAQTEACRRDRQPAANRSKIASTCERKKAVSMRRCGTPKKKRFQICRRPEKAPLTQRMWRADLQRCADLQHAKVKRAQHLPWSRRTCLLATRLLCEALLASPRSLRIRLMATRKRKPPRLLRPLVPLSLCQALLASPRSLRIRFTATRKRRPPVRGAAREPRSCHG